MGIDVLLAPAEKTGVGDAVKTAKHKQTGTNDNLSSLCHDGAKAIAGAIPELSAAERQEVGRRLRALRKELVEAKTPSAKEKGPVGKLELLMHYKEQVGRIEKMVPLILTMYGTGKRGKKLAQDVRCHARKRHSTGLAHTKRNNATSVAADDCK